MVSRDQPLDRRYLHYRRSHDEAKALRRCRATKADLAIWRRDKTFRDMENAAKVAPRSRPQIINAAEFLDARAGLTERWVAAPSEHEQNIADRVREALDD